jgi:hypothetical protein
MIAVAAIALPAAALASDPTADQYGSQLQTLSAGTSGTQTPGGGVGSAANATPPVAGAVSATESGGSSLPFTGFDVGLLAAIAAGLGVAGFMLRRQAREASKKS